VKCHPYYPVGSENEGDDEMVFNDVGLKVSYITERHTNYHFTTRIFQLLDLQVWNSDWYFYCFFTLISASDWNTIRQIFHVLYVFV